MHGFATPPDMTISQWADAYRILSPESSAESGRWRTDRAPYQKELMNAMSDPHVERVILKTSAQIGKTESLLNVIGYYIDYDPSPILYVMPTDGMAKTFSEDRLSPMLRDCPTLRDKVDDPKSRTSGNTIFHKKFTGGHLTMVGANAPSQLASRPIRILLCDEVDRFPASAGSEGDPVQLAIKRTTTFWNRKIILVSTPTLKGASKIDAEYDNSSAEELNVACPHCGELQPYVWDQIKFEHESGTKEFKMLGYVCKHCGTISKETLWKKQPIKWVAEHPEIKDRRGFHLNEMASPWKTWDEIVTDFLEAKRQGREMMKVWHNTALGLSWEEDTDLDIDELLAKRRKYYNCLVPKDVLLLTAGVDVQDNRLEYEVLGWGIDKKTWGIKYGVIMGDPGKRDTWAQLDDVLFTDYEREDGLRLQVATTCIDSGGHFTSETYAYCKRNEMRRVWAIKGHGGSGIPFITRPSKRNQAGAWLFTIGVDVGKDTISSRLKVGFEKEAGFCNFPMEADRGYNEQYFLGLTAERRNVRTVGGKIVINWVTRSSGARNEPFDIRNYATAAFEIRNPNMQQLYLKMNTEQVEQPETKAGILPKTTVRTKSRASKGVDIW